ncbi:MAG: ECF-type sigma factor [Planctomycetota bacterium]
MTQGQSAADPLVATLYRSLKRIAAGKLGPGSARKSLQVTDLVHEAYLRLDWGDGLEGELDQRRFLAAASKAMRSVLVDKARARSSLKRQQPGQRVALDDVLDRFSENAVDLLALEEALERLEDVDEPMARAVELRFFAGLATPEIAEVLGVPRRTLERRWAATRAWLYKQVR